MRVAIVGTGYVGLTTGAGFASAGHDVVCLDKDVDRVEALRRLESPFYEPGLDEIVAAGVTDGRLRFTADYADALDGADAVFLCVGTPSQPDGSADLTALCTAAASVAAAAAPAADCRAPVVVVKSTVPPGTTVRVVKPLVAPLPVASNPEFLKEGDAVRDFLRPDRVVLGVEDDRTLEVLKRLYAPFVRAGAPVLSMDPTSAELSKYATNSMLAARISLMNELAAVADRVGADIEQVRRAVGADKRIGPSFLFAGVGFGGSCFRKDVKAMAHLARAENVGSAMLRAVLEANENAKADFVGKVLAHFGAELHGRRFAVWGLAFKPGTDDMRDAPSLYIVDALARHGAAMAVHDPKSMGNARRIFESRVRYAESALEAAAGADALLLLTEWPEYRGVDLAALRGVMQPRESVIFDGRNVFEPGLAKAAGFTYYGVGRR